jgi:predicted nucleotidyltransferase
MENRKVSLLDDAVDVRPIIIASEDRTVGDIDHMFKISRDLFDQFSQQIQAFASFLKKYWNQAYSALFVFQFQLLEPVLHYEVIHIMPSINGKGISVIMSLLFSSKGRLEIDFYFDTCTVAPC